MIKVFVDLLPGVPYVPLLYPTLGRQERGTILFLNNAFRHLTEPLVQVVDDPRAADYLLIPHNESAIRSERAYLRRYITLSREAGKKILLFAHTDSSASVDLPNVVVFRTSLYRYRRRPNEIPLPAYAEDLLGDLPLQVRDKHAGPPVVGFCGWVEYKNLKNRVGTLLRNAAVKIRSLCQPEVLAETKGITLRRRAMDLLERDSRVMTSFIRRRSYSGHTSTIGLDPARARREYIENMLESDVSLVVKGDGNYSYRFYEALSLGRIPLLLDTACRLPLEEIIDYSSFVIRVPLPDLPRIADIVAERYARMSAEEFREMQRKAREAFEKYLRIDRFLKYAVENFL